MAEPAINPENVQYFHGLISREEAEKSLTDAGCSEGLYLLRESTTTSNTYALSLCHRNKVYHYAITRNQHGMYSIEDGKKFPGPVELVRYHEIEQNGLLSCCKIPCIRPPGQPPKMGCRTMVQQNLEGLARDVLGLQSTKLEDDLTGSQKLHIEEKVLKIYHLQPDCYWFHRCISRDEAERRLLKAGPFDGKFLIRERDEPGTFAIGLCYGKAMYHYRIDRNSDNSLSIKDGRRFGSLVEMVYHYSKKADGLFCPLDEICPRPGIPEHLRGVKLTVDFKPPALDRKLPEPPLPQRPDSLSPNRPPALPINPPGRTPSQRKTSLQTPAHPAQKWMQKRRSTEPVLMGLFGNHDGPQGGNRPRSPLLPPSPRGLHSPRSPVSPMAQPGMSLNSSAITNSIWDESDPADQLPPVPQNWVYKKDTPPMEAMGWESPYSDVTLREGRKLELDPSRLQLKEKLGAGNFGSVLSGTYQLGRKTIEVAVKTLKTEQVPNEEPEILKEANMMKDLDHPHIVRMIGVCHGETIMLVLELAPLGPLNKYLKKNASVRPERIVDLMTQVAEGMAYLESKNFVHRDLAARNILLVSELFAKISDFGMSKALGLGSDYYKTDTAGKWPLKWYAPECIYYYKFSSKADVWSYGVTLWEAFSNGRKPYAGMKGQDILTWIESDRRLDRPPTCSEEVYAVMRSCWQYKAKDRPTFAELSATMKDLQYQVQQGTILAGLEPGESSL
ncbi:tyrosine-protein kinase SYK-like isoform X2 [Branchiostoma floridae]|uniref:Tyrosine-protein kinase n=1 Tax=Branchiostoma floridae TaxID=7739 RepID=A0A9J7NC90_BRAFL|nr:tyrosine-protein kinase SYK-like isoform X2 [Branchiostoma floridae]